MKFITCFSVFLLAIASMPARADIGVDMYLVNRDGTGESVGTIHISETGDGLQFTPALSNLPPGLHGFHVHENPDCGPDEKDGEITAGAAAGGHYDPGHTGRHAGPWANGHKGDLPMLRVDEDGKAITPVTAPDLELDDLDDRSLVIHAEDDNYSDYPEKLGGSGARIACGLID